jgi:hypothetical protein
MTDRNFPPQYARLINEVLQSYPELEHTHIRVQLKKKHPVPYGTTPPLFSFLKRPEQRVYTITILEEADSPVKDVLFKHLTTEARQGVIAHQLFHILQLQSLSRLQLLVLLASFSSEKFERDFGREADRGAIDRGYGWELHNHAVYIRSVPGYVEKRPAINENYLLPAEIRAYIAEMEHIVKKDEMG